MKVAMYDLIPGYDDADAYAGAAGEPIVRCSRFRQHPDDADLVLATYTHLRHATAQPVGLLGSNVDLAKGSVSESLGIVYRTPIPWPREAVAGWCLRALEPDQPAYVIGHGPIADTVRDALVTRRLYAGHPIDGGTIIGVTSGFAPTGSLDPLVPTWRGIHLITPAHPQPVTPKTARWALDTGALRGITTDFGTWPDHDAVTHTGHSAWRGDSSRHERPEAVLAMIEAAREGGLGEYRLRRGSR